MKSVLEISDMIAQGVLLAQQVKENIDAGVAAASETDIAKLREQAELLRNENAALSEQVDALLG